MIVRYLPTSGYYAGEAGYYSAQGTYYAQGSYNITINASTSFANAAKGLHVGTSVAAAVKHFVIDDPLDPANELLFHTNVESPDVKNIYNGIITLDQQGDAVVQLPDYFDALNTSVRYQLKPIGASMPNLYVSVLETNNQFSIAGGVAGGQVSWQVTGIRHDPYILANPIDPLVAKGPNALADQGPVSRSGCVLRFLERYLYTGQDVLLRISSRASRYAAVGEILALPDTARGLSRSDRVLLYLIRINSVSGS